MSEHDRTPPPAPEPATDATTTPWMSPALSWAVTGVAALVALAALAVVVVQLVVLRPAVVAGPGRQREPVRVEPADGVG